MTSLSLSRSQVARTRSTPPSGGLDVVQVTGGMDALVDLEFWKIVPNPVGSMDPTNHEVRLALDPHGMASASDHTFSVTWPSDPPLGFLGYTGTPVTVVAGAAIEVPADRTGTWRVGGMAELGGVAGVYALVILVNEVIVAHSVDEVMYDGANFFMRVAPRLVFDVAAGDVIWFGAYTAAPGVFFTPGSATWHHNLLLAKWMGL